MTFAQTHTRFIAKSRIVDRVLKLEHGHVYLPFDAGGQSGPQKLTIQNISSSCRTVRALNDAWWTLRDHGAIRFGRIARLDFDGEGFSAHLNALREELAKCNPRSTRGNELIAELEVEQALYDSFAEARDIEFEVLVGERCVSFTLQLRYGESPRVLEPELIHPPHDKTSHGTSSDYEPPPSLPLNRQS